MMKCPGTFVFFASFILLMGSACTEDPHSGEKKDPPLVIAHRGASEKAPENTIPAVQKAWEAGADAVEVDVRLTKDDRIVAIHDRSTERTTGRKLMVHKSSYDTLSELDAGSWFDPSFEGTRIPLLDSVMDQVPASKELFIEIKSGQETVRLIGELLSKREAIPAFSIISFDLAVVEEAKQRFPKIPAYWVLGRLGKLERRIDRAKKAGLDGLNFHHRNLGNERKVRILKEAGLRALCWTVNDTTRAKALIEMGVEGVTTDRPSSIGSVLVR